MRLDPSLQTNNYEEARATSSLKTDSYKEAQLTQASKFINIRRLEQLEPSQTCNNKGAWATRASKLVKRRLEQEATWHGGSRLGSNSFFSNCARISLVLLLGRNSLIAFLAFTRFCCIRGKLPNTDTNCKSCIFGSPQPILKSIRQNSSSESVFISCTHSTVFALKFYFLWFFVLYLPLSFFLLSAFPL